MYCIVCYYVRHGQSTPACFIVKGNSVCKDHVMPPEPSILLKLK